ncbi:inositol monophosphatase 3-like [Uloborus diversus]|uniref:inositol monophosphatase 3-like n=1 Tax=Uloborus diversus TaxID=327109 RepID=UPI00240960EE|nr:inositol monophosphatase 3-like [Uloborus diversus]
MNLPFIRINPLGMVVLCGCFLFLIYIYASNWNDKSNDTTLISLKHLLAVSVDAAELGGLKVREVRQSSDLKQSSKGKTKEGANDPLTYGDILSHKTMLYSLKKAFPNLKVISEEHDDKIEPHDIGPPVSVWGAVDKFPGDVLVPTKDIVVWIDPLDATQEYTENLLQYVTTMVCVAVRGKPVIGVIHQPFQNVTVWGWDGRGTSNPKLASAAQAHDPSKPFKIIVSRSHSGKVKEVAKAAFGPETEVISAGGAGFKSLQVAEGKADAYIHVTLIKKWDICAGNALLNALGGKMTALDGTTISYGDPTNVKNEKGLVASLHNHDDFVHKLSSLSS